MAAKGLFYPRIAPCPCPPLGGNVAESSGGLRPQYGTTKDYVMGMEIFANTGDLVKTGSRTVKCATGHNIAPLLVGSKAPRGHEQGYAQAHSAAELQGHDGPVQDMDGASQAVAGIIAAHVVPCTLEFLDHASINYIEDYVKIGLPVMPGPCCSSRWTATPRRSRRAIVEKVLRDNSATEIVVARDAVEKEPDLGSPAAWPFRAGRHADAGRRHGAALQDPAMIRPSTRSPPATSPSPPSAGDGNHPSILCDRRDKEEFARMERAVDDLFNAALGLAARCPASTASAPPKSNGWSRNLTGRSCSRSACARRLTRRGCSTEQDRGFGD